MLTPFRSDLSIDEPALEALVDFYLEAGAGGLLAACWSSESECMGFSELLLTVAATMNHAGDRVPVAATPHAGDDEGLGVADRARRLFDAGVQTVVFIANRFAAKEETEDALVGRILDVVDSLDEGLFGIYEAPFPYHRLLTPEGLGALAASGRFVFHKDTACDLPIICSKLEAIRATPLRFYNANSPTLLDSLVEGGHGYSGIGANFFPDVYVDLCKAVPYDFPTAWRLQHFLNIVEKWAGNPGYPMNAKIFLSQMGIPIEPHCRIARRMTEEQRDLLGRLMSAYQNLKNDVPLFPRTDCVAS